MWTLSNSEGRVRQACAMLAVGSILICAATTVLTVTPPARKHRNAWQDIKFWNRLRKFAMLVENNNMSHYFERSDITVFVPLSSAYEKFLDEAKHCGYNTNDRKTMEDILLYHIADGVTSLADMETRKSVMTLYPGTMRLFFNSFTYRDTTVDTVNGAWIRDPDIVVSNGLIHLIDEFLIPVQSEKTVADFLEYPDIPNLSFQSIKNASIVDMSLRLATNTSTHRFTVFCPNDSYITVMPDFGKDILFNDTELLKSVFWAHIVEEELLFIPRLGDVPNTAAKAGILKFRRNGNDLYVYNNKVRARVVQSNIPVDNGVLHVIDDLLYYVYRNIRQTVDTIKNAHFMKSGINKLDPSLLAILEDSSRKMTLFLPTDEAFAKLPSDQQIKIDSNLTYLTKMFKDHIIMYAERDIDSLEEGTMFTTYDGKVLTIRRIRKDVYVEGDGVRAKITTPDIGCSNGVIHLVNSVLFQRDFTIWDAIKGNSQLRHMRDFVLADNQDLLEILRENKEGPMTVFMISDGAVNSLPEDTRQYLGMNTALLKEAIHGSIAHGVMLGSTQIVDKQDVPTLSGRTITLYSSEEGMYIVGSRIRANVIIEDVWCSNGVLHITDNIIHLPTRNIVDEMARHSSLSVVTGLLQLFKDSLQRLLADNTTTFTMFVPRDDAFTYMPTHRAKTLAKSEQLLKHILMSHIVQGSPLYVEQYGNYSRMTSLSGDTLFVVKKEEKVYANSNNVQGEITEADIRCTNGLIHVVDTFLQFPFFTVADVMEQTPELQPFYNMLQTIDDFYTWSAALGANQTIFVPSATFIAGLSDYHKTFINSEPGMIRKIFNSHFIPSVSLSQGQLQSMFDTSRVYVLENRYNYTFTFLDRDLTNSSEETAVDIGYSNLQQNFDLVRNGIACSNGIIYIINGFLNYPLYDTLQELKRQPEISIGTDQLIKLIPSNASMNLESKDTVYTVFAPADGAFNFLTMDDINYINQNLSYSDRMLIVRRHIIEGQQVDYDRIIDGSFQNLATHRNITVLSRTDGFYLRWNNIETKIIRPNLLATNGIIHVVDRLLLTTPYQTTTTPPTTTTAKHVSVAHTMSSSRNISNALTSCIVTLVLLRLLQCTDDYR